jgi:hypothetical protein
MVEQLEFLLNMDKTEYLLGEPATAFLEVKNSGSETISAIDQLDPQYDVVKFYIKNANGEKLFRPFVVADSIPHMVSLDPGKSVRGTAKVFYGAEGWSLKSPGTYKITATYKGLVSKPDKIFTSNIAEIKIRAPENDQEKDQVNLIMGDEQGKLLLFEGGDHLSTGMQNLTQLTNKYPQSDLAAYANFAIGMNWSRDFKNFHKKELRPANTEKSASHLENAKTKLHGYYANKAYLTLADIYDKSNDKAAKKNTLNEFVQRFSGEGKHIDSVKKARSMLADLV